MTGFLPLKPVLCSHDSASHRCHSVSNYFSMPWLCVSIPPGHVKVPVLQFFVFYFCFLGHIPRVQRSLTCSEDQVMPGTGSRSSSKYSVHLFSCLFLPQPPYYGHTRAQVFLPGKGSGMAPHGAIGGCMVLGMDPGLLQVKHAQPLSSLCGSTCLPQN